MEAIWVEVTREGGRPEYVDLRTIGKMVIDVPSTKIDEPSPDTLLILGLNKYLTEEVEILWEGPAEEAAEKLYWFMDLTGRIYDGDH